MPYLSKRVVSNYFRTDCPRQLRLLLSPHNQKYEPERQALGMPPKAIGRTGIAALTQEGSRWEQDKLHDLEATFGAAAVVGTRTGGDFQDQDLRSAIGKAVPGVFLVRPSFDVGPGFRRALGIEAMVLKYGLGFASLIPDLIQAQGPG